MCFCYTWKVNSLLTLNFFIFGYEDKILPRKEMKEAFSVKLQDEKFSFHLRWKLNETRAAQIIQSLSTSIRLSRPVLEAKKNLYWSMIMKILLHIVKNLSKASCREASVACTDYIWGIGESVFGKCCYFYSHLSFETVFSALKLTKNGYIIMNISISWKLAV